jgi:hypothetical protein
MMTIIYYTTIKHRLRIAIPYRYPFMPRVWRRMPVQGTHLIRMNG